MKSAIILLCAALFISGCTRNTPNLQDQTPPEIKWIIQNQSNSQTITLTGNQEYNLEKGVQYIVTGAAEDDGGLKEFTHFTTFGFDCECSDTISGTTPGPLTSGPVTVPLPLDAEGKARVNFTKIFGAVTPRGDCSRRRAGCVSNEYFKYECGAKNYGERSVNNTLTLVLKSY
jgi:hypothetical protein